MTASWGSTHVARLHRLTDALDLDGFVTLDEHGGWLGYASYEIAERHLEIVVLESPASGRGAGSALIANCVAVALERGLDRVWLITTNDNLHALRFYQRRGFVLADLHRDNVTWSRQNLKPELPEIGLEDIPIRDELELEIPRAAWTDFVARYGV